MVASPAPTRVAADAAGLAIRAAKDLVTPRLRAAVQRLDPRLATIAGYHLGWCDAEGRPVITESGKMLRAALVLLSARACGAGPADGISGAVAVELVHNFSLLHDDVMDGDQQRRHRPTAWSLFGVPAAVLTGDALLTLALDELFGSSPHERAGRCLAAAVQRLCSGQMSDLNLERQGHATLAQGLAMAAAKTGALIGAACAIGAILAKANSTLVTALQRFGEHLGLAFQLTDDLLGVWGDPAVTGKPVLADLRSRKKSVPVLAALSASTTSARQLATLYAQPHPLTDDQVVLAATLIDRAGGRTWTEAEITRQIETAARHLDVLGPDSPERAELLSVADFVTTRNH